MVTFITVTLATDTSFQGPTYYNAYLLILVVHLIFSDHVSAGRPETGTNERLLQSVAIYMFNTHSTVTIKKRPV